ncbi:MAG: YkgJ family cysteine cluster protein [Bdellovibrionaceae bacterium]|nr:YkgJ family cysteine cluster protein [Pseudobdellovibrionaceae bacterium]
MTYEEFCAKHKVVTRSLKKFIDDQKVSYSAETYQRFLTAVSSEILRYKALIYEHPAGPLRARKVHELVEAEIAQETEIPASCFKGCSHCCHLEVEVTNYETEILQGILMAGHPIDRVRLTLQGHRKLQDSAWRNLKKKAENRCVFLGADEACSIYEDRPVMCRRHSVTSNPQHCADLDEMITVRYFPKVDVILSAANEDPDIRIGPMAKMLI